MLFDAVVVAGGRSSRLGGTPKAGLVVDGTTLLERALDAVASARRVVVVGPVEVEPDLDERVIVTREDPPFGGPVAAIAAGLDALDGDVTDYILVLACDMPDSAGAVEVILEAVSDSYGRQPGGFVAVDDRPQPLLAVYDSTRLRDAIDRLGTAVSGSSMHGLLAHLDLIAVEVPEGSADDVDTWLDAARYGIEEPR